MQTQKYPSATSLSFWRSRTVLDAGVVAVILVAIVLVLEVALHFRQVSENEVATVTQNLANTLQSSIEGLIEKMDVSLKVICLVSHCQSNSLKHC